MTNFEEKVGLPSAANEVRAELERLHEVMTELRARLQEPEEIMRAIRDGEVDAFVVTEELGERIYSLRSADIVYRGMVEEMREGAVALDASGLMIYCNQYFASLMKAERSELLGYSIFPFVPDQSRPFFDDMAGPASSGSRRGELVLRATDGTLIPVRTSLSPVPLEGGHIYCLIVSDLTGERGREKLLVEGRRKDEFLAMLAHELRNPITPIRNAVNSLKLTDPAEPTVRRAAEVIDRQVSQLTRLVDDLLDISRISRGKIRLDLQRVDLRVVIAHAIETAQPAIDARCHELTTELPAGALWVQGDSTRLSQVVSNILHNAAKFTAERGHIAVKLEQRGAEAAIIVRDDGVGIPAEMQSKIFDVFTQVDSTVERSAGGLGLGLALVRRIVELHRGRVTIDSQGPGTGSEFLVSLPLLPASAVESPADLVPTVGSSTGVSRQPTAVGRRILVVDDNADAAETLTSLLRQLGHDAVMATEGNGVVDLARDFRPHAVLLDIGLPDRSGYQVAADLRQLPELEGLCLVALTGYGNEEYRRLSQQAGFDHHWVKPLDLEILRQLLDALGQRAAAGDH
jgi:PAS domain S-box-containing protein